MRWVEIADFKSHSFLKIGVYMSIKTRRVKQSRKKSKFPPAPWQEFIEY